MTHKTYTLYHYHEWLLLLLLTGCLYYFAGSASLVQETQHMRQFDRALGQTMQSQAPKEGLVKLLTQYQQKTKASDGYLWFHLGQVWEMVGEVLPAQQAYAKAYARYPEHPEVLAHYAQTYSTQQQPLPTFLAQDVEQSLVTTPEQPELWNILAMNAFLQKQYPEALGYWHKMLPHIAQDLKLQEMIKKAMAVAEQKQNGS